MATLMARSALRSIRRGSNPNLTSKKNFSAKAHDDAYETKKWERVTYAGIVSCTLLAIWNLSKGHPHYDEPPAYPYLHVRNKEFPWGPDGLFEVKQHH